MLVSKQFLQACQISKESEGVRGKMAKNLMIWHGMTHYKNASDERANLCLYQAPRWILCSKETQRLIPPTQRLIDIVQTTLGMMPSVLIIKERHVQPPERVGVVDVHSWVQAWWCLTTSSYWQLQKEVNSFHNHTWPTCMTALQKWH